MKQQQERACTVLVADGAATATDGLTAKTFNAGRPGIKIQNRGKRSGEAGVAWLDIACSNGGTHAWGSTLLASGSGRC